MVHGTKIVIEVELCRITLYKEASYHACSCVRMYPLHIALKQGVGAWAVSGIG